MFKQGCIYFLMYLTYAFLGWILEVSYQYLYKKRFVNRGFLIGPLCPIYAFGSLAIVLFLSKFKYNIIILFIMSMVICSILEYATSVIMEKLFKTRWWDYSERKFNLNGRICAETMIPFGILGCIVIYLIHPFVSLLISKINDSYIVIIAIILFILYLFDNIISVFIINKFKKEIVCVEKDITEEITKKVQEIFLQQNIFYRRLVNAFPSMINARERLLNLSIKINNEIRKLDIRRKDKN